MAGAGTRSMSRSGDVLQIVIMTMFMVSGILLLVNMVFARQRDESRRTVEQAVRDHAALQRELTDETFRGYLLNETRLTSADANTMDFGLEINTRCESIGLKRMTPATRRAFSGFVKWTKRMDAPEKEFGRDLVSWVQFMGRIEDERPDIRVERLTLDTKDFDYLSEGEQRWGCSALFVYWESQKEG